MSHGTVGAVRTLTAAAFFCAVAHAYGAATGGRPSTSPGAKAPPSGPGVSGRAVAETLVRRGFTVDSDGLVGAMVELAEPPAVEIYRRSAGVNAMSVGVRPSSAQAQQAAAAARAHIAHLDQVQQATVDALTAPAIAAETIYRVQRVYNGIAVRVDGNALEAIRALPGVKAVHPLVPKRLENSTSVPFLGAPQVWGGLGGGATGAGVRVGVIDSGIDYLHADFGGSGQYRSDGKYVNAGWPTTAKVVGGYDFAGDKYDASGDSGTPRTAPDPDPMDCGGHGSHVAGTLAGYGENADGSTFTGPWNADTPVSTMKIGPGVAPEAQLYALKVFGCSGTTGLVTKAIDWALDPNGDGNFADHLDVISLSLGSAYGVPDDPDVMSAERAAEAGVIVVMAAGNSGDAYYVVGGPGVAARGIAVAATGDPGVGTVDLRVNSPQAVAGDYAGEPAAFGPALPSTPITGTVVYAEPHDGCSAITNPSAVRGNIAIVDRNYGASNACNFTVKVKNAQAAGAVAAIVADNVSEAILVIMSGSDATISIPSFFISLADGQALEAQLPQPGIDATLITVSLADTVASFSARGPRSEDSILKPDIAAPGLQIYSAAAGTGSDGASMSGTSMATPHVAGVMALLRQLHPSWTVEELKALAMNAAVPEVTVNPNAAPPLVGTGRIGAGRADVAVAATAQAVAFSADDPGVVSVSFGVVEVAGSATLTRNIAVENKSSAAQEYALGFTPRLTVPGVTFSLPSGAALSVPAGGSATFPVQLNADASAMRHTMDPSISATSEGFPRAWLSEADGYVTITPSAAPALRVPVYSAPRPVSAMSALQSTLGLSGSTGTATLDLVGQGIRTGTAFPTDIVSLVSALELVESNSDAATTDARYVGVTTDYEAQVQSGKGLAESTVYFGVAMKSGWTSPEPVVANIEIDITGDGKPDYDLNIVDYSYISGSSEYDDVFIAALCKAGTTSCVWTPLNGVTPDVLDTVQMNTDVLVLPVRASDLGLTTGTSRFGFYFNRWAGSQVVHTFDPVHPGLSFGGAFAVAGSGQPIFPDLPGQSIQVSYSQPDYASDGASGILLLHHHNAAGSHAEAVAAEFGPCSVSATATVPASAMPNETVLFQAGASATACGGDPSFLWDFGDGSAASSLQNPSHAYGLSGTYSWRVVVSYGSFSTTRTGSIVVLRPASAVRRRIEHAD